MDNDNDGGLTKEQVWNYFQMMKKQIGSENITREAFDEEFEKLDLDADQLVTLADLKKHGMHKREKLENLAIGIVWIGHTLDPGYFPHDLILKEVITYETDAE